MTRATLAFASLLREPDDASFNAWLGFVARLALAYLGVALLAGVLVIAVAAVIALTIGHASASAMPETPDRSFVVGCVVILPPVDLSPADPTTLRATAALSACDDISVPIAFGGSMWDLGGRR